MSDSYDFIPRAALGGPGAPSTAGELSAAGVESSFPVDFRLIGRFGGQNDGQASVLYSRVPVQSLDLEIYNTSRGTMTIAKASATFVPGSDAYFYLTFQPGTLWDQGIILSDATEFPDNAGWVLAQDKGRNDKCPGYYLYRKDALPDLKAAGEPIKVQLGNIQIDGSGGSRSTSVELRYSNITTSGYGKPLSGSRERNLAIMDELPVQGKPPIAVQWVGPTRNQVLNNNTPQKLVLRLLNQSGHALPLTSASKITLSFPQATRNSPWGLLRGKSDLESVTIGPVTSISDMWYDFWTTKATLGQYDTATGAASATLVPELEDLEDTTTEAFEHDGCIDIHITMNCSARSGIARVLVHYEGFGGLVDDIAVEIVKTPLIISRHKVGIGTAQPQRDLSVQGGMNIDQGDHGDGTVAKNALTFGSKSSEGIASKRTAGGNNKGLDFYTNSLNRLAITHDGKVGIGTTSPQEMLSVQDGMNIDQADLGDGTLLENALTFGANSGEGIASQRKGTGQYCLNFYTQHENRMTIGCDGDISTNLGMHIDQADSNDGTLTGSSLTFGKNTGAGIASQRTTGDNTDGDNTDGLDFYTNFKRYMSITKDGKIGVGTTGPQQNLSVQGGMNIDQANTGSNTLSVNALTFGSSSTEGIASKRTAGGNNKGLDFYTNSINRMAITAAGWIGIGTTDPQAPLHVVGSVSRAVDGHNLLSGGKAGIYNYDEHDAQAPISASFSDYIRATGFFAGCDKRLKDHVGELSAETALAAIKAVRPVFFHRRPDWETPAPSNVLLEAGFYAQELSESIPTATVRMSDPTSPDGTKWQVCHDQLHAYAAGAIQALAKQIEELKAEISALKAKGGV